MTEHSYLPEDIPVQEVQDQFAIDEAFAIFAEKQFELSGCQEAAAKQLLEWLSLDQNVMISLTGQAGSGKTFLAICMYFALHTKKRVVFTALTHKACNILRGNFEDLGMAEKLIPEITTLHSYLGVVCKVDYRTGTEEFTKSDDTFDMTADIVFVDESSMMGEDLYGYATAAARAKKGRKFILVGDPFQLPPVNEDLSPALFMEQTVQLQEVKRHNNTILELSNALVHAVRDSSSVDIKSFHTGSDIIVYEDPEAFDAALEDHMHEGFKARDVDYAKALSYTNATVQETATFIRESLGLPKDYPADGECLVAANPHESLTEDPETGEWKRESDLQNGQEVFAKNAVPYNYESEWGVSVRGYKVDVFEDLETLEESYTDKTALPKFSAFVATDIKAKAKLMRTIANAAKGNKRLWKEYFKIKNSIFCDLRYAQSSTIHKSQGSSYKHAFIDLVNLRRCRDHDTLRRLMYVACSRASKSLHILVSY